MHDDPQSVLKASRFANTLLVDMGNQRVKWSFPRVDDVDKVSQLLDAIGRHGGVFNAKMDPGSGVSGSIVFPEKLSKPEQIVVSSVSHNQLSDELDRYCLNRWDLKPVYMQSGLSAIGLMNGYDNPAQLGCDRWFAAIAAHQLICCDQGEEAVVIIDAGTAVTVDLVANHRFEGGAILPGLATIVQTLGRTTGRIRINCDKLIYAAKQSNVAVDKKTALNVVGKDSNSAVYAGAIVAVAGGIDRCLHNLRQRVSPNLVALLTGGDSEFMSKYLESRVKVENNLVLAGLALAAAEVSH